MTQLLPSFSLESLSFYHAQSFLLSHIKGLKEIDRAEQKCPILSELTCSTKTWHTGTRTVTSSMTINRKNGEFYKWPSYSSRQTTTACTHKFLKHFVSCACKICNSDL